MTTTQPSSEVWGAVLAAGQANRFGGGKQVARFQGRALAAWPVLAALAAGHGQGTGLDHLLVMLGVGAAELAAALPADPRLQTAVNPRPDQGMGSSLALAARLALEQKAGVLVVLLGDQPLVQPQVIARVAAAALAAPGGVAAAWEGGRRAHPIAFARPHLAELAGLKGDQGGRDILARLAGEVALVETPAGSALDVDTPRDLARAKALAENGPLLDWAALGPLCRALGLYGPQVAALVGSGGKTTLMHRLAREIAAAGGKVVVTTTTRIYPPQAGEAGETWFWGEGSPPPGDIARRLAGPGTLYLAARSTAEGKLAGLGPGQMAALAQVPELWVLVEADGSARLPLKGWAPHEPACPAETGTMVVLAGASGLGRRLSERWAHRPLAFAEAAGIRLGDEITPLALARALSGSQGPLRALPPGARAVAVINQAEAASPTMLDELFARLRQGGAYARLLKASLRRGSLEIWRGD